MVTVDPKRAVRCSWCGTFESDKWRSNAFQKGLWCSRECYLAGHLGAFIFSSIFFPTLSVTMLPFMFLFYNNSGNELGLLSVFALALIFIPFAIYSPILTYRSYRLRMTIMKFHE
ncbi:MAG: hypothetical protein BV458_11290 [Thermoplasmata archaeon M9B2D]|nr:MAG: hypothetical protein BV458_11290 [Thermoplasmata archaeon M9B2D]